MDGTLALLSGGTATINGGILKGVGNVAGDTFNTGGHVAPGDSPGELTVTGAYTQTSGGALDIELGGSTPGNTIDTSIGGSTPGSSITSTIGGSRLTEQKALTVMP